jgi:hypothetical protein
MNLENVLLWLCAVTIWLLVVCWILGGVAVARRVAVWIGNKVADLGGGGPR